jgi:hypothetical protein
MPLDKFRISSADPRIFGNLAMLAVTIIPKIQAAE